MPQAPILLNSGGVEQLILLPWTEGVLLACSTMSIPFGFRV